VHGAMKGSDGRVGRTGPARGGAARLANRSCFPYSLVDDVVTKGATLLGVRLTPAGGIPQGPDRLLRSVRTRGLVAEIEEIEDAVAGTIRLNSWGGADRAP